MRMGKKIVPGIQLLHKQQKVDNVGKVKANIAIKKKLPQVGVRFCDPYIACPKL